MNKITDKIEDVQNTPDKRHLDIDKVGIKSIRHPISVKDKTGGDQSTVAMFDMYVHLPHNFKGTHMSRFVEILNDIETYHATPLEAAKSANLANVKHLIFYHLTPAPRNALMEKMFFRGVNDVRKDWTAAKDGTMVVLPLGSDEIIVTKIN